jgi:hypothetical protein
MAVVSYGPSHDIERVAEPSRDARAFTNADELGGQPESGVAIHGICARSYLSTGACNVPTSATPRSPRRQNKRSITHR